MQIPPPNDERSHTRSALNARRLLSQSISEAPFSLVLLFFVLCRFVGNVCRARRLVTSLSFTSIGSRARQSRRERLFARSVRHNGGRRLSYAVRDMLRSPAFARDDLGLESLPSSSHPARARIDPTDERLTGSRHEPEVDARCLPSGL